MKNVKFGGNLKVLVLHNTFLPDHTGSSIRLYNLLSRIPYQISVLTPEKMVNGSYFKLNNEIFDHIEVKRITALSPTSIHKLPLLRYYHHEKKIFDASKKECFDIIQSRTLPPYIISAYKLHKKFDKPLIIEAHPHEDVNAIYMYYIINLLKILKKASHIITLTNSLKRWVQNQYKLPEKKITVIPNGVNSEKFKPKKSHLTTSLREKLGNPEKIVFYSGYLDVLNGMDMILQTIPNIVENYPGISFVFMGHGPYYNQIKKLSEECNQVHILPTVDHELMPQYYQISDLFVIPRPSTTSSELITPLKLLEALSMERVVLGSDVGGIKEAIVNGKNGYLYEKDNPQSFKDILIKSLESKNVEIAKEARKTVLNEYNWDNSAQKLKGIYDHINY